MLRPSTLVMWWRTLASSLPLWLSCGYGIREHDRSMRGITDNSLPFVGFDLLVLCDHISSEMAFEETLAALCCYQSQDPHSSYGGFVGLQRFRLSLHHGVRGPKHHRHFMGHLRICTIRQCRQWQRLVLRLAEASMAVCTC